MISNKKKLRFLIFINDGAMLSWSIMIALGFASAEKTATMQPYEKEVDRMAIYVTMSKEYEDEEKVAYSFGPNEEIQGKIEFNKLTKKYQLLEAIEDEETNRKPYARWAAEQIALCYKKGVFPDKTSVER